jgi:hypothetical protein
LAALSIEDEIATSSTTEIGDCRIFNPAFQSETIDSSPMTANSPNKLIRESQSQSLSTSYRANFSKEVDSNASHAETFLDKRQTSITQWTCHCPLIAQVPFHVAMQHSSPTMPNQIYNDHLIPYGTPLPIVDHTKILRACAQNTQHSFKLYGDDILLCSSIDNLLELGASMCDPISPNINWHNPLNWLRTRHLFQQNFKQVHLSAVSSDIGLEKQYIDKSLIGGSAILTFGLWASKVSSSTHDLSGNRSYSMTTIQGKLNKKITLYLPILLWVKEQTLV